jgi:pimeloyl-ACP methyl ester carboxylesterase
MGHSLGNNMATDFLVHNRDKRVQAFVGVSMEAVRQPKKFEVLDNVVALLQVKVPVLDIYGSEAIEPVTKSVDRRAYVIYQALDDKSRQVEIEGANHFFEGYENQLLLAITNWLDKSILTHLTNHIAEKN